MKQKDKFDNEIAATDADETEFGAEDLDRADLDGADLNGEEFNKNQPRKNLVTGIPEDEVEFERKTDVNKPAGLHKTIAVTVIAGIAIMSIALFFIFKGRSGNVETANVKDNSVKFGINANTSEPSDVSDFQTDYQKRYGANAPAANGVLPPGSTDANMTTEQFGTVGGNITAPPPLTNPQGGIYQPPMAPAATTDPGSSGGSGKNSGGAGGSASSAPKPVETTRIKPSKTTEIVELGADEYRRQSNNGGGHNEQVSLYFYERAAAGNNQNSDGGRVAKIELASDAAMPTARPEFGTVLPVKILGRLHTLGTNGFARMELTRTVQGKWGTLPRGTMFVGRVAGGEGNRLFVALLGYIDPRSNRLVTLGGDLQGKDGALGLTGDVKNVGSRWNKAFGELFGVAKEIGSAYLLGRSGGNGTVINNGQLSKIPDALEGKETTKFVLVPAGAQGYIVINELPPAIESDERLGGGGKLSDDDILKMLNTQSPDEVQKIIPQLSPRGQQIARGALR